MSLVTFLASFLIYFLFAAIPVLWWIDGKKLKENTLHATVSLILAWVISQFLKDLFSTSRPFMITGHMPLTITYPVDGAFPSSHMAAAMALSVALFLHNRKLGIVFVTGSILVGVARVMAHVHYPVDIAGGALLGTIVAISVNRMHLFKVLKFLK